MRLLLLAWYDVFTYFMRRSILGWGIVFSLISVVLDAPFIAHAQDVTSSNYQILAPAKTNGGGYASSGSYSLFESFLNLPTTSQVQPR